MTLSWSELIDLIELTEQYIMYIENMINSHSVEPEAIPSVLQRTDRIVLLNSRLKAELLERKETLKPFSGPIS